MPGPVNSVNSCAAWGDGGWLALLVTALLATLCMLIRRHYQTVARRVHQLYRQLMTIPPAAGRVPGELAPREPTAVLLVTGYGGLGIHTLLSIFRLFPNQFRNVVFVSVGVIDSGEFKAKGEDTAAVDEAERVCLGRSQGLPPRPHLRRKSDLRPRAVGPLVLHNDTAHSL